MLAPPVQLGSPPGFSGVRAARSLMFCVVFCRLFFVPFLAIVLYVLPLFTASEYPFDIFKYFLYCTGGGMLGVCIVLSEEII